MNLPSIRSPRRRAAAAAAAVATAAAGYATFATAATVVPVPDPAVIVTTKSGGFTRTTAVPIGGAPIPIDVDGPNLKGLLEPDIDVSVGMVALGELPEAPVVPNIKVVRSPLALASGRPAPPLELDAKVVLRDANAAMRQLVEVHYGFKTPEGAKMPPVVQAKLVGPVQGGFIDPLVAKIESPGYGGPLDVRLSALTDELDAKFDLDFDALPESILVTEDPREDGLDVTYDHTAAVADVHLDATATLKNRQTNATKTIAANIERLPRHIELHDTITGDRTQLEYVSSSDLNKPDVRATYSDGPLTAKVNVAGLPHHMTGEFVNTNDEIDKVDFKVLEGDAIDAVDFEAKNYATNANNVPEPQLGPDLFAAVATRDGDYRAAGRLAQIRAITVERTGDGNDTLTTTTDLGDGTRPLRALLDLDDRHTDDGKRLKLDTTITPLPQQIHTEFTAPTNGEPTTIHYDASTPIDVDADALIATGTTDDCGTANVTCLKARVDKVPAKLDIEIPGDEGKRFVVNSSATSGTRPDVRATIDTTGKTADERTYVDVALNRIPPRVTGWLDAGKDGVLRAAEFHGCDFDFGDRECAEGSEGAIGRVDFTVRELPTRAGLPPRADTADSFVSIVKRPTNFEAAGRVTEVRNVEFHQLDRTEGDGKSDNVLGVKVDVGSGGPFDAIVDAVDGDEKAAVDVTVAQLPQTFEACVRQPLEAKPPSPDELPKDALLAECHRNDVVVPGDAEPAVTPLAAFYKASQPTKVEATVKKTAPDADDDGQLATQVLDLTIDKVPGTLRADVIPPKGSQRKLKLAYNASSHIDAITFGLQSRRASSICGDPRPGRKALCLNGTLKDLPKTVTATYDPDESKGDIDFFTSEPETGKAKPSITGLKLTKVEPGSTPLVLTADITGLARHLKGTIRKLELDGENADGETPMKLTDALATCGNNTDDDGDGKVDANDADCDPSPAELSFDACPDGPCDGIERIEFAATNALVGAPVDDPPAAGIEQQFSLVQVGEDFKAAGLIKNLRQLGYRKTDTQGKPSRTTTLKAAFGNNQPLRAYVSRETGAETQKLDGVITDAPNAITLCMRDKAHPDDGGEGFCNTADASKLALQAILEAKAETTRPDVDLRTLELGKGGKTTLAGKVKITDLTERLDVLVGRGAETEILAEGRTLGGDLADVAARVDFEIRNFAGNDGGGFPWKPLDGGLEPEHDTRNQGNYVRMVTDADGALLAKGSIPGIKRVQLQPQPCNPQDPRFPQTGFLDAHKPSYQCVRAIVAPGKPLGLAVRTLDAKGELLSVEEGHVTAMPDELAATIGKSPDAVKTAPMCDASNARPCKVPMLSVQAPGATGELQAKLAVGDRNLNNSLKLRKPDDPLSQRLNFEEAPRSGAYPRGARVKVGTTGGRLAIRAGLKVKLPKFLDLDPPTLYDCNHANRTPGPECAAGAKKENNAGYESKDIFFRLVAADDKPLGNPKADEKYLGRVALMVEPFGADTQMVLTGMPAPDHHDPLTDTPTRGADSRFAEDFPEPGDPSEKGFLAPAHLDAQVFLRNDFNAVKDGRNSTSYTQVDGRINAPLSMALRLNERPPATASGLARYVPPQNRAGTRVPPVQLTIRNAPSSNNADWYVKPTFRIRAELRDTFKENSKPGLIEKVYTCDGDGYGIDIPALLTFCALLPVNSQMRYLDVQLNADPYSNGTETTGEAARTVDAVAGPFGAENNADIRGWREVDGTGGPFGKGEPANVTPVAALRLTNFNLGLRAGTGIGLVGLEATYEMLGDLIVGMAGHATDRTRLASNLATLRIASEGGRTDEDDFARAISDLKAQMHFKLRGEALFGLVGKDIFSATSPFFRQPIEYQACSATGLLGVQFPSIDEFWTGDSENFLFADAKPGSRKATIGFGVPPSFGAKANEFNIIMSQLLQPLWCVFSTSDGALVNDVSPAPGYTNDDRLVPGQTGESNSTTNIPEGQDPETAKDLHVAAGETKTLCGTQLFDEVVVDGTLAVADESADCGAALDLHARKVVVNGTIEADGARTSNGGGFPAAGAGGGAGHVSGGGRSGKDRVTAGAGPGGGTYSADDILADVGSRGRDGDGVAGGRGGGAIRIVASDRIEIAGRISANGDPGASATGCGTGGGGGSAGAIELTGNLIAGSGSVQVRGGNGGDGGFGGGGGSGGRLRLNSVVNDVTRVLDGGSRGGTDDGTCDGTVARRAGVAGGAGSVAGTHLTRAAHAELHADTPGPLSSGPVKVAVSGFQQEKGPLELVLCRRSVGWDAADPFSDVALDPHGNANSGELMANASCSARGFSNPSTGTHEYRANFEFSNLDTNVYGFFAFARKPHCSNGGVYQPTQNGGMCVGGASGGSLLTFTDQTPLPGRATAKIGVDRVLPDGSPISARNGAPGCPVDSLCLAAPAGEIEVTPEDSHSGVSLTECRINDGAWMACDAKPTTLTLAAEGLSVVDVRITDKAGNERVFEDVVKWFVDATAPEKPDVVVHYADAGKNGWHKAPPAVYVEAWDDNPSSGFPAGAMKFFVDQRSVDCSPAVPGTASGDGKTLILCPAHELDAHLPDDGVHKLGAELHGRFDQVSEPADVETLQLDKSAPKSFLFLGPEAPDGDAGHYRSAPFFAFAATDGAGGSGVDRSLDRDGAGTGIHYRVDGGDWKVYDPESPANVLTDGVHEICWYAVDLAGNEEAEECRSAIRVDTTAPAVSAPISPAAPDGFNGYYTQRPVVTPVATGGAVKTQVQVDGGAWTTIAEGGSVEIAEGTHVVRVRAFDAAGNGSEIAEREVRVDASAPYARVQAFPPAPGARGWFRQPVLNAVAVRDGRDASGAAGATVEVDGATPFEYAAPFEIGSGVHAFTVTPRDRAGLAGEPRYAEQRVDTGAPTAAATGASGSVILSAISPRTAKLNFTVGDALSDRVRVHVNVYNELGALVRRLDNGGDYRSTGGGYVVWDGKRADGSGVAPGLFHYRVHVVDEAGNTTLSAESASFPVILGVLPLPGLSLSSRTATVDAAPAAAAGSEPAAVATPAPKSMAPAKAAKVAKKPKVRKAKARKAKKRKRARRRAR